MNKSRYVKGQEHIPKEVAILAAFLGGGSLGDQTILIVNFHRLRTMEVGD
ncbi:hypothetical protein [Paenibacillus amylolyticus]